MITRVTSGSAIKKCVFIALIFLGSLLSVSSLSATEIEIGNELIDSERIVAPKWMRIDFAPSQSGRHVIRIASDDDVDLRFSVFLLTSAPSPNNKVRLATSGDPANVSEWEGELDSSEQYYLAVWSVTGTGQFSATLEEPENSVELQIAEQPTSVTVSEGEAAIFSVVATGDGDISYQWFMDGILLENEISDTLEIPATVLSDSESTYSVQIENSNGSIQSGTATLVVLPEPAPVTTNTFGQGAIDADKITGPRWMRIDFQSLSDATHTIDVSWDSDANVRYRVFESDGTSISAVIQGANPGLWSGALTANTGYYIALWSTAGAANYTAKLSANVPISIDEEPSDRIVTEGDDASFRVVASGSGVLTYQWFANGQPIVGENGDTLVIPFTLLSENNFTYYVEISNGDTVLASRVATLTVNEPVVLGRFSQDADEAAWMLDGPASTLDFQATENSNAWGQVLLRIGDTLLVGGDFQGIKPTKSGRVTSRPFLATLDAVTGQPISSFQIPSQINSVVRSLALSTDREQLFIGGDFGLLAVDPESGELFYEVAIGGGNRARVFEIAVHENHLYIGGDFTRVNGTFRANLARLSLDGVVDPSWNPRVTHGFSTGRAAPVQSIAVSPSGDTVYVGGNFKYINDTPVMRTPQDGRVSMFALSALDGTVQPERFYPSVNGNRKGLTAFDIVVTDFYVIIAWGGPNYVSFHSPTGDRLQQFAPPGDVQALQVLGAHLFIGHHGEYFGTVENPVPPEAVVSLAPRIIVPYKLHSFRIDDPSFVFEQAWEIRGAFGVWGISVAEDSIWVAGDIFGAGSNGRVVEGLARFPALD